MNNSIRIVSNPVLNTIAYYFKNETGEWKMVSKSSILSRNEYVYTSIEESVKFIIDKVTELYNRNNKGLNITFEGTAKEYDILSSYIAEINNELNITLFRGINKVIFVGKKGVGKSSIIHGIEKQMNSMYEVQKGDGFTLYFDKNSNYEWYEIDGIDIGPDSIDITKKNIENILDENPTTIVYCVDHTYERIENVEMQFYGEMIDKYPEVEACVVLTRTLNKKNKALMDQIMKLGNQIKVIEVLTEDFEVDDNYMINAFGIEELSKYIFERR